MHLKMSSAKWRLFGIGLNEVTKFPPFRHFPHFLNSQYTGHILNIVIIFDWHPTQSRANQTPFNCKWIKDQLHLRWLRFFFSNTVYSQRIFRWVTAKDILCLCCTKPLILCCKVYQAFALSNGNVYDIPYRVSPNIHSRYARYPSYQRNFQLNSEFSIAHSEAMDTVPYKIDIHGIQHMQFHYYTIISRHQNSIQTITFQKAQASLDLVLFHGLKVLR